MVSSRSRLVQPSVTFGLSAKAKTMKKQGIDVISFGIGEPDFHTPESVKQAARDAIDANKTGYTPSIGEPDLRQAIKDKLEKENGLTYELSQIAAGNGGKGVLYHIFLSLLDPSDEVVIITPYWVSYPEQVRLCGGVPVFVQCDPHTFAIDSEDLKAKVSAKTRIILINSPSNPCGVVYTEEQLRLVADLAQQHNSYILSDEVYEHFYYGEKPRSIASLHEDAYARTIIVNAVSKTYAMTGWRIGFVAAADKEVIAAYSRLQDHTQSNPCSIAQWAAVEAYTGSQDSVTVMRDAFRKRRDSMVQLLNAIPGLHCATPEGAFYCFPRYELAMPSLQLAEQLLEEAHVVVMPGEPFGLEGYLRLSYAVADEHIPAGIERLHAWFAAHPVI